MNLNIFFALVKALLTGHMGTLVDILQVNTEMLHYTKGVTEVLLKWHLGVFT